MTCATCGRDNPAHLTFCQECGQRLGPRIAPPTPPIGLGGQDAYGAPPIPSPGLGGSGAPAPAPSLDAPKPRVATELGMAAKGTGERRCRICDTPNGPTLRYCTSCGSTLDPVPVVSAIVPAANAAPSIEPAASPYGPPPAASSYGPPPAASFLAASSAPAIAPMRVVDLGGSAPAATDAPRICARCRGTADSSAQFCKFCGAPLDQAGAKNGESKAPRAGTAPIAQVAAHVLPALRSAPPAAEPLPATPPPQAPSFVPRPASVPPPPVAAPAPVIAAASLAPAPAAAPAARLVAASGLQRGRLVVIAKSGADGPSYPFGDVMDVGRTEGHVIVGEDPYLSPRHVRILWNGGKLTLRDLASTNGVFLRLAPSRDTSPRRSSESPEVAVPLVDQDVILVGQQVLRFDILREGDGGLGPAQEHGTLLFGSPAAPRYARLCQRTVEGIARDVYYIRKLETVLGRESGDVVFTEDPFLSRRHAAIRLLGREGGGAAAPDARDARFALVDLGSSNGTFLRLRGDVELVPGDHFRVGQQLFRVDFDPGARS